VQALSNKNIVAISCGETHTMALTDSGHLYSFGANGCGQLGQFQNEFDKKRRESYEEISFPRITNDNGVSFMSGFDSSNSLSSSPRDSTSRNGGDSHRGGAISDRTGEHLGLSHQQSEENSNVAMISPLLSPPPLQSANDYGIETICQVPKLVKSLMHRKVIRISSGGVHNICIVESMPSCILTDVYTSFMNGMFTDVIFKGFYTTQ